MSSSSRTIGELIEAGALEMSDGYRTKRSEHGRPGYRIVRVADIHDGTIDLQSPDFVSDNFSHAVGAKAGQWGDILLTTKGTVGRVAIVPELFETIVYSPQVCYFRLLNGDVVRAFLRYWFSSAEFLNQASHRMNNTDMAAYINLADIRSLRISLPIIKEQRAIAEVLGALDDKIAANAKLVDSSAKLAQAIFTTMLDWAQPRPLTETATFVNGKAFTKDASGKGRVVIRIAELNSGIGPSTVYNDIDVTDDHLARPGDLLFAWSGSLTLHRWFREEAIINQHIFKVTPLLGYPIWLVNQLLVAKLEEFRGIAADKATTMGHIQRKHLDELVPVPDPVTIEQHDGVMSGLWSVALSAEIENELLAETRDALLPALMSGKLRVKDAEKQLAEVL